MPAAPAALAYIAAGAQVIGTVKATADMATGSSGFNVGQATRTTRRSSQPTSSPTRTGRRVGRHQVHRGWWILGQRAGCVGLRLPEQRQHRARRPARLRHPERAGQPVPRPDLRQVRQFGEHVHGTAQRGHHTVGRRRPIAEGTPEDPWVALRVAGRFDPVGPGDFQFSFKLDINQFGHLNLSRETFNGTGMPGTPGMSFSNQGSHIHVTLH